MFCTFSDLFCSRRVEYQQRKQQMMIDMRCCLYYTGLSIGRDRHVIPIAFSKLSSKQMNMFNYACCTCLYVQKYSNTACGN